MNEKPARRCDRILALIDACLAENEVPAPSSGSSLRGNGATTAPGNRR
jgi:hypothetical protein